MSQISAPDFSREIPVIEPVAERGHRPLWSVMIPTYNCARLLRTTLESVLAQDPGRNVMQIEVVDDCSTKDDPEAVVHEMASGRVSFFKQPSNGGAIKNFNTCIRRSVGEVVHILHGDDWVSPGFYACQQKMLEAHPDAGMAFTRTFVHDEDGSIDYLSHRMSPSGSVVREFESQWLYNHIYTPSAVVRRSVYEKSGGFMPSLPHVADWEMWDRVMHQHGGVAINEPLAHYRFFAGNDTSRLARVGENVRDTLRLGVLLEERHPRFDKRAFVAAAASKAAEQHARFRRLGDLEASENNAQLWKELTPAGTRLRRAVGRLLRRMGV